MSSRSCVSRSKRASHEYNLPRVLDLATLAALAAFDGWEARHQCVTGNRGVHVTGAGGDTQAYPSAHPLPIIPWRAPREPSEAVKKTDPSPQG
jgi:hypothetical protein